MTLRTPHRWLAPPHALGFAALVCFVGSTAAIADTLRFQGDPAPRRGVFVGGFEDGEIVYRDDRGRPARRSAAELVEIALDEHPGFAEAGALMGEGDARAAEAKLRAELGRAVRPWAEALLRRRLVRAREAAGRHAAAVESYLALAQLTSDPYLLGAPPLTSARALEASLRRRYAPAAERLAGDKPERAAAPLSALARALRGEAPAAAETPSPDRDEAQDAPRAAPAGPQAVLLPSSIDTGAELPALILAGRFEEAAALGERRVERGDRPARSLFLLGAARLGVAERSRLREDFLRASIPLLRVAIHFGPSGEPLAGPALVEAGYIHQRLGRLDQAKTLYDLAAPRLDAARDPAYTDRLRRLQASLAAEPGGPDG
ncbi:MAG: hypothetical protein AAF612_06460 [Planctomycetota bacterium]